MKIFKIAQTEYLYFEDVAEEVDRQVKSILDEYYHPERQQGTQMSWDVIPFARLKKIWEDYMKHNVVHDTEGLDMLADKILSNLARLEAATQLAGHSQIDTEDLAEEAGHPHPGGNNVDFYFDFLDTKFGIPVSDFGLRPLWNMAEDLLTTKNYEEKLMIIDKMLNVVHQRGDIAALFVEGGSMALSELSGTN